MSEILKEEPITDDKSESTPVYVFDGQALSHMYWKIFKGRTYIQIAIAIYTAVVFFTTLWIISEAEHFAKYGMGDVLALVWFPWIVFYVFYRMGKRSITHILRRLDEFERYNKRIIHINDIRDLLDVDEEDGI